MKTMRALPIALAVFFLSTSTMFAQDLSRYRDFSLGMHLADVAKRIDKTPADAKLVQQDPAVIQELTWWPMQSYQGSARVDPVEEAVFSFYNGALYKVAVSYDSTSTQGLTAADMTKALSAEYGVASRPVTKTESTDNAGYSDIPETIALWQDAQHYVTLVRSSMSDDFQLVLSSKQMNSQAEAAIAAAATQAVKDAPQIKIARAKKEAADLEATRQANLKAFRP